MFHLMQLPRRRLLRPALVLLTLVLTSIASASLVYQLPKVIRDEVVPGWEKIGGYNGPSVVLDPPDATSNSLPALILDSHMWGDPTVDPVVDTTLVGDTSLPYAPGTAYVLKFHFARFDTAPNQNANLSPFYGAFAYQVWAGHPDKGSTPALRATSICASSPSGPSPATAARSTPTSRPKSPTCASKPSRPSRPRLPPGGAARRHTSLPPRRTYLLFAT
jgi:hypothetical protein